LLQKVAELLTEVAAIAEVTATVLRTVEGQAHRLVAVHQMEEDLIHHHQVVVLQMEEGIVLLEEEVPLHVIEEVHDDNKQISELNYLIL